MNQAQKLEAIGQLAAGIAHEINTPIQFDGGPTPLTARKFHGYLNETTGLELGYSPGVRWLHEQDFWLKMPQPWHDRQDEELREAFVGRLRGWLGGRFSLSHNISVGTPIPSSRLADSRLWPSSLRRSRTRPPSSRGSSL